VVRHFTLWAVPPSKVVRLLPRQPNRFRHLSSVNRNIFHHNSLVNWGKCPRLSILGRKNVWGKLSGGGKSYTPRGRIESSVRSASLVAGEDVLWRERSTPDRGVGDDGRLAGQRRPCSAPADQTDYNANTLSLRKYRVSKHTEPQKIPCLKTHWASENTVSQNTPSLRKNRPLWFFNITLPKQVSFEQFLAEKIMKLLPTSYA